MPLTVPQQRAIAYLSVGLNTTQVAQNLDVSRMTLCRWRHDPEFQAVERKTVGENMAALTTQCQNVARVLVEGALDAANQLRHLVLKPNTTDRDRRMAAKDLLQFAGRFFDMMGFHGKAPQPERLAHEDLPDLADVHAVGDAMRPGAVDPDTDLNPYQPPPPEWSPAVPQASSLPERHAPVRLTPSPFPSLPASQPDSLAMQPPTATHSSS